MATFNGLFILGPKDESNSLSLEHHFVGQRVRCINSLSLSVLILGLASRRQLVIYDLPTKQVLKMVESPTLTVNSSLVFYSIQPLIVTKEI